MNGLAGFAGGDSFQRGLRNAEGRALWPARFVWEAARDAAERGVNFQTQTVVCEVSPAEHGGVRVATGRGAITARHAVIVCTNGWTGGVLPELRECVWPVRNHVALTRPLRATWPMAGWTSDDDSIYCTQQPDGRAVLGGARKVEPGSEVGVFDDATLSARASRQLHETLLRRFPQAAPEIAAEPDAEATRGATDPSDSSERRRACFEREWTGILGFTSDGKPLLGWVPGRRGVLVAAGFNGHGMPVCWGAGAQVADMALAGADSQAEHAFARACDPARFRTNLDACSSI